MRVFDSRKLLMFCGLLLITTLAVHGASSKETAVVKDLSVNTNGDSVEVKIATTERVQYTYFELANPRRLVVDFHGLHNDIGFREKTIDVAGVQRVRTSYFTNKTRNATRVVFDLAKDVPYKVGMDSEGLVRVFFGIERPATETRATEPASTKPAPAPVIAKSATGEVSLVSESPETATPIIVAPEKPASAVTTPLPTPVTVKEETIAVPSPVVSEKPAAITPAPITPAREEKKTAVTPVADARTTSAVGEKPTVSAPRSLVSRPGGAISTSPASPASPVASAPQVPGSVAITGQTAGQQYTGEIVNIDVRDMDLKDFFRFIADVSGLNIVLDPAVSGAVTLTLTDVPWDQALDIVLKNHQLGTELQGNVLRIARRDTLIGEETARENQRRAIENAAPLSTKSYILNYRKADLLFSNTITKFLSPRGNVIPDVPRNAIIVNDIPDQFAKIDEVIQFLDAPAQQVQIEARLLSANKTFSRELGSQLGVIFGNNSQNKIAGAPSVGTSPFSRTPPPNVTSSGSSGAMPLNVNLPAAGTSGISFLLGAGANNLIDEIITAAEARGTARILSKPHVMTQNNQAATIQQGTQIPVQTNQNNTVSVQYINFSLKLTATPQITNVGTILLNVNIENSLPDFARAVNGIPSVATQSVTTNVLMGDGETLVIGGILVDQDTNNIAQVPGLGSIPLIGALFRNNSVVKSTAELIFFITPRVQAPGSLTITPAGDRPPGQQQ